MILKGGPSNYSILWKGSKLSFPLSTVLIKANKQKVWHNERTLTIESRKVLGLCEKLLPFIIQHYLLLGWPRIISQVLCLAYFQKPSSCTQNQLSKLKLWAFIISKDQLRKPFTSLKFYILFTSWPEDRKFSFESTLNLEVHIVTLLWSSGSTGLDKL